LALAQAAGETALAGNLSAQLRALQQAGEIPGKMRKTLN